MGLLGRTRKGYTLLIDPAREFHNVLFWLLSPVSSWMYVQVVDMRGTRNLDLQPFLKQDALWQDEGSLNLYFNNVSWTWIFPQKEYVSNAQPPFMWYKKVYAAMSNLSGESRIFVSGLFSCALLPGMIASLNLLRDWLTISTVVIFLSHLSQYIMPPFTLLH